MTGGPTESPLPAATLEAIERQAVTFARLAGERLVSELGRAVTVSYKSAAPDATMFQDPVSEIDQAIERMVRLQLARVFPEHDIVGEEVEERTGNEHDMVWVIDPIDGTTNFINGFPLFAASIGVLYRGQPVVGALWCSTGHLLRPGVYHARLGATLRFDLQPVQRLVNPEIRRQLAGAPTDRGGGSREVRKTGSAALECAFVAAGLLEVARFDGPYVWDVGGGVALVQAAGLAAYTRTDAGWVALDRFAVTPTPDGGPGDLRSWRQPLIVGSLAAVEDLCREAR